MNNLFFLLTKEGTKGQTGLNDPLIMTIFMVVFIAFFYFVVIRPQNKKKKEAENMLKNIKPGDKVVTIGGCHGKVVSSKDDTITIRVDDKAELTFDKNAIARVIDPNAGVKDKGDKKKEVADDSETKTEDGSK